MDKNHWIKTEPIKLKQYKVGSTDFLLIVSVKIKLDYYYIVSERDAGKHNEDLHVFVVYKFVLVFVGFQVDKSLLFLIDI